MNPSTQPTSPPTIPRPHYLSQLQHWQDRPIIKAITGIRRCGKSTLLRQFQSHLRSTGIPDSRILSFNLDDPRYLDRLTWRELYDNILLHCQDGQRTYIFLDEVQNIPDFEKCVNALHLHPNLDIYITGSNSFMLSSELATHLTGRYIEIHVLTLSLAEYWQGLTHQPVSFTPAHQPPLPTSPEIAHHPATSTTIPPTSTPPGNTSPSPAPPDPTPTNLLSAYSTYTQTGGFPYLLSLEDATSRREYIENVFNTVLIKDVITRSGLSNVLMLRSITRFLMDNIGNPTSVKKISDTLKSAGRSNSVNTIEGYLSALESSFIIYPVSRYDLKGKEYLRTGVKYYIADLGLRHYLLDAAQNRGAVLENLVFLELKRRGYEIYVGKYGPTEVDFVISGPEGRRYLQVSESVQDPSTLERELRPLRALPDNHPKHLLTLDPTPADHDGIQQSWAIDLLMGTPLP